MTKEKRSWMVWSNTLCWSSCFVGHLVCAVRRSETEGGAVSMCVSFHRNFDDLDEVASALNEFGIPCAMLQGSVGQCLVNKSQHKYQWLWSVKHLAFQYIHMWQTYFICEYQSHTVSSIQSPFFSTKIQYWYHLISFDIFKKLVSRYSSKCSCLRRAGIIRDWQNNPQSQTFVLLLSLAQSASGLAGKTFDTSLNITKNHWTSILTYDSDHFSLVFLFPFQLFFLIFKWIKRKKRSAFSVLSEVPTSRRRVMWSSYIPCWLPTRIVPWATRCRWIRPRFSPPDNSTCLTLFWRGFVSLRNEKMTDKYSRISTDKSC